MPVLSAQRSKGLVWPFASMTATAMLTILILFMTSCSADEVLNSTGLATLNAYVTGNAGEPWQSRGTWYNILEWAARSTSCSDAPDSVACMACSQAMPAYAQAAGVGPIAVADELWFQPTKSAVCGMCLKISISPGMPSPTCTDSTAQTATCPGSGTTPYTSVNQPWAWNATVYPADANNPLPYFIAVIIEWFDRNQTLPYEVTYPTQNVSTDAFGTWPIIYEGIECPVGNYKLQYHFENVSTVIGTANSSLCDNELNAPCGTVQADERPFAYLAFKAIGERIPLAAMQVRLFPNASWLDMARSGADYWQINDYATVPAVLDPTNPLDFKITCSDGKVLYESGLVPADMFCSFQDPKCKYFTGTVQC